MLKQINVYDLDGVLVDSSHRYRNKPDGSIDLDYWFANRTPEKIQKDKILPLARHYLAACLNPNIYSIICTSRVYSVHDISFILSQLGAPDKLLMRPVDNDHPDAVLKRRQLGALFNLRQFRNLPRFLWEDNPHNIASLSHMFDNVTFVKSNQGA